MAQFLATSCLVAMLFTATGGGGIDIEVSLHQQDGALPSRVAIEAVDAGNPGGEPFTTLAAEGKSSTTVSLPRQGNWILRAIADGHWSAPVELSWASTDNGDEADGRGPSLDIVLWRSGELEGRLVTPQGVVLPEEVSLRLRPHAPENRELPSATVLCPVDQQGYFRCEVPLVDGLDLRLRVAGFASRFLWDVDLRKPASRAVGIVELQPGASVVGRLDVRAPISPSEVEILLTQESVGTYGERPTRAIDSLQGRANELGHFSFEQLDPGVYRLRTQHPELASPDFFPVYVVAGAQTEIAGEIVVTARQPIRLAVDPQEDLYGRSWTIKIFPVDETRQATGPGVDVETLGGYAETSPLALGLYGLELVDSSGERLLSEIFEHRQDTGLHQLEAEMILVKGKVTLGGEPLLAGLTFGRPMGIEVSTESDFEGEFRAYLPEEGIWDLELKAPLPVVRWRDPKFLVAVEDGEANLEIALPDTHLQGVVVDEEGTPVSGAYVEVVDQRGYQIPVTVQTDSKGSFSFSGLREGTSYAQATSAELESAVVATTVGEGLDTELRLVLREKVVFSGRIVDPAGNAIPSAWLHGDALDNRGLPSSLFEKPSASTDSTGRFEFRLPATTVRLLLTAMGPGFTTTSSSLEPGDAGDIELGNAGGTLTVELDEPLSFDFSRPLPIIISSTGQILGLPMLANWGRLQGMEADLMTQNRMSFPAMEPGAYRACWAAVAEMQHSPSPGADCVGGFLAPHGELNLRFKPAPGRSATSSD